MFKLFKKRPQLLSEHLMSSIFDARYVVIDTELTGLDYKLDSIVSIGGIKMVGTRIVIGKTFYRMVNPKTKFDAKSVVIHNIVPSEVQQCPSIDEVLMEFIKFCGDDIIVGHFLNIDISFINKELGRVLGSTLKNPKIDTWILADWIENQNLKDVTYTDIITGQKDLVSLAKKYGIEVPASHNALIDAYLTAQLFQRLLLQLKNMNITTVKKLLKIGGLN
jgi:DNA polymerase-3 subunit epsilon